MYLHQVFVSDRQKQRLSIHRVRPQRQIQLRGDDAARQEPCGAETQSDEAVLLHVDNCSPRHTTAECH